MDRRTFLGTMLGAAAALAADGAARAAGRERRRRHRRRVRRRIRRRVAFREVAGRRWWVVPTACAAGWELAWDDRVVVVREIRTEGMDAAAVEVAVVADADGTTEEAPLLREDTKENAEELEGSILPDDDTTTPAIEREEEIEDAPRARRARAARKEPEDKPAGKTP